MSRQRAPEEQKIIVVLVGRTQSLKNSAGNLILDFEFFTSGEDNLHCEKGTRLLDSSYELEVINTPCLLHNILPPEDMKKILARCVSLCAPGPHAILIVIDPNDFREEEIALVEMVSSMFRGQAAGHTMILFPLGNLAAVRRSERLKAVIRNCKSYHFYRDFADFFSWIQENGDTRYTCSMFEEAQQAIYKNMQGNNPDEMAENQRCQAEKDNSFIQDADQAADAQAAVAARVSTGVRDVLRAGEILQQCILQ